MSAYKKQVGGSYYLKMKIQPSEFINKNNLPFAEGNAIKYICRHQDKGEINDLQKAKHYIEMIIERDYTAPKEKEETWIEGYNKWKSKKERCPHN